MPLNSVKDSSKGSKRKRLLAADKEALLQLVEVYGPALIVRTVKKMRDKTANSAGRPNDPDDKQIAIWAAVEISRVRGEKLELHSVNAASKKLAPKLRSTLKLSSSRIRNTHGELEKKLKAEGRDPDFLASLLHKLYSKS